MKDLLLIDGYNIMHAWADIKDQISTLGYDAARTSFIDMICNYSAHSSFDTIIVFDAHMKKGNLEHTESFPPVKVVFTAENETADHYIERLIIREDRRKRDIYVATSDAMEQTIIFGRGGSRISARELERWVHESRKVQRNTMDDMSNQKNTIAGSLSKKTLDRLDDIIKDLRLEK